MKNFFKTAVILTALFGSFFVMADYALTGSDVYVSHSTGACVEVKNYDGIFFSAGNYSCDDLPKTYTHVWTK